MFPVVWCCMLAWSIVCSSSAQDAQIVSPPETVGVYSGQTAVLKCRIKNLGNKMVRWTLLSHNIVIFEGNQLLAGDAIKYSLINTGDGHNLQISDVGKVDQGFYQCAIEGTSQQIIIHLNVLDVPEIIVPFGFKLNMTDCCINEKVTESCLPGCYPSQVDLDTFNATENCGSLHNLKGLSKCFTAGSNHDNCCLQANVDYLCLGFCHNEDVSEVTPEQYSTCFKDEIIIAIFACFEAGFDALPNEPTEVNAIPYYAGTTATIQVKWNKPKRNADKVIAYIVMLKPRTQKSYNSTVIHDVTVPHIHKFVGANIKPDMDYRIRVSALASHGVSYGSVEVDIYFPPATLPNQINTDINACCFIRITNEECRNMLCHSKTWSKFNTDDVLKCFPYLNDVFTCLVGERNHTNCCAAYDVTPECLPICSGHPPPLNSSLIGCVSQMSIIEACVQQGYTSLPVPPTEVTIMEAGVNTAIITYQPSVSANVFEYVVELRKGDEKAPFERFLAVDPSVRVVHLSNLEPNTYYWVRIFTETASIASLPSDITAFLTYPENYEETVPKVTNVPHNMTECCMNTGMPEACWKGCEYRTNITSYYIGVLETCLFYIGDVLSCGADGRDHKQCCQDRGMKSNCIELCAYTRGGILDMKHITCVSETPKAVLCFQEGIVNLPRHPDVVVANVSKSTISISWEQPKTSGAIDIYIITYGPADSVEKLTANTSKTSYILQNLQPDTRYEITVTSQNINGTSPPSPVITQYTLDEDISIQPTLNQTEVYGRALWQNISHCCESNFKDDCLKQCLNNQTANLQHTPCISEGHNMLACSADGKDHRLCCEKNNLPSVCVPICGGSTQPGSISLATCMSYDNRAIIISCFLENSGLVPGIPSNFGAKLEGPSGSVKLTWSPSINCNTGCTYVVHYWRKDQTIGANSVDNISDTFKVLNVEPGFVYTFAVTAQNMHGSSAPSAWQTINTVLFEKNVNIFLDSNYKWVENGQPAKLICEKIGFNPDSSNKLVWYFNNSKLDNDGKMTLFIPRADPTKNEGVYTCTVTDSEVSSSDSFFLLIKYAPILYQFKDQSIDHGLTAMLECSFRGLPDLASSVWLKNKQPLKNDIAKYIMTQSLDYDTGITIYRVTIYKCTESDYGTYSLSVTNTYGTANCNVNLKKPSNMPVTPTPTTTTDMKECCIKKNVSPLCQILCDSHVNITEFVHDPTYQSCIQYFKVFFQCGADSVSVDQATFSQLAGSEESSKVGLGIGITIAVCAAIAIIAVAAVLIYRYRLCSKMGNNPVTFENQTFGNPGQIKIHETDGQYNYGRLHEDNVPEVQASYDGSSSEPDTGFENAMYKLQQPNHPRNAASLSLESHS